MNKFHWTVLGNGKFNLILIHGLGFNSNIWHLLLPKLYTNFKIYLVDLPGYGKNTHLKFTNLNNIAKFLAKYIPSSSILLGWSMGGLITHKIAIFCPKKIKGIINVSSSPCFIKHDNWPGISKNILNELYTKLILNYKKTIKDFINIQFLHLKNLDLKIQILKKLVLSYPKPTLSTLKKGLKLLCSSDLRKEISKIKIPYLKIYGAWDVLVPKEIFYILDKENSNTKSIIMKNSSHAPFISEQHKFCFIIHQFSNYINTYL
ncbi:MAG: pimeloyl-ACP methyl ester esterase BioH [Buchnera aphidicola (Nurudea shiraii)]